MSVDTTVVIAALVYPKGQGEREYTAKVVQAAEDLLGEDDVAFKKANLIFLDTYYRPYWFSTLQLAKQLAALLTQDQDARGGLEYRHQPMIEINLDDKRVYLLSRKGNRKTAANSRSETFAIVESSSIKEGPGWSSRTDTRSVTGSVTGSLTRHTGN